MSTTQRIADVAFWIGLILWVSAIITAGMSAAMAFPTMHEYEVIVPKFDAFDHSAHWSIAAGLLMERMFFVTDIVQLVVAIVVIIGLGVGYSTSARSIKHPMELMRTICIAGAALMLAYRMFLLAPEMNRDLHGYWNAAEQGNVEVAAKHRDAFQSKHPTATRLYGISMVLLLAGAAATAWSPPAPPRLARLTGGLEEPQLAKTART